MSSSIIPEYVKTLIEHINKLPGIGNKTATRIAFFYLNKNNEQLRVLGEMLLNLNTKVHKCSICHMYSDTEMCQICSDSSRRRDQILVVEQAFDIINFENTGVYNGMYHVLNGVISPINGIGPKDIYIEDLVERVGQNANQFEKIEVIVATNLDVEGEATANYISHQLSSLSNVYVTILARGLPYGAEVNYADQDTLKRAFEGRHI